MYPSSFEWGRMLLCFKVCDPYDRVFSKPYRLSFSSLCPCPPIWSLCFYSDFELGSGDHYDLGVSVFLL